MIIGDKEFSPNRTYVAGILNVTDDSFSDGGKYLQKSDAVNHAIKLLEEGADIIDIGGESARPGSIGVGANTEFERVVPVIEETLAKYPKAIISVDTTKSKIAFEALRRGAKIINDISAATFDSEMFDVVKEYEAAMILMHMKGKPFDMQVNPTYSNIIEEIKEFLAERISIAKEKGIKEIIVDPGIGFGKTVCDNYKIIKEIAEFKKLEMPVMIGVSRKSFIGKSLNLEVYERETPTAITEAIAIQNGADFVRTHNVKNAVFARKIAGFINNPVFHG